jgi:hypothetical protein
MKSERSGRNLAEKSGMNQDLKWDENYSILFCFLNWYEIFQLFQIKQNEIDTLASNGWRIMAVNGELSATMFFYIEYTTRCPLNITGCRSTCTCPFLFYIPKVWVLTVRSRKLFF